MSFEAKVHWLCDECKKEVVGSDYKFPVGWNWIHIDGCVEHRCDECSSHYTKGPEHKQIVKPK